MRHLLIATLALLFCSVLHAQDCYTDLLNKGIKEYNAGNYATAKLKWNGALDCPDLTYSERQSLNNWIADADKQIAKANIPTTPSIPMPEMVFVQGGAFKMGSNEGAVNEKPIHSVSVDNFYIGKYEITVVQFAAFIKETAYVTTAEREDSSHAYVDGNGKWQHGIYWKHGVSGSLHPSSEYNHPVIHVSWYDATAYCEWLSRKTNKKYRLPTEAEWEYAARGGNRTNEYKYSGSNNIGDIAWYYDNANKVTHTIGTKQDNELGIFDMTGNVWEWCNDWYDAQYYQNSLSQNPLGAASGSFRVIRGGAWNYYESICRVTFRYYSNPADRSYDVGFRVVRYD